MKPTPEGMRADCEEWYDSETRPFDASDCSAHTAAWYAWKAASERSDGVIRELAQAAESARIGGCFKHPQIKQELEKAIAAASAYLDNK